MPTQNTIVSQYVRMWPREVFDVMEGKKLLVKKLTEALESPGVYILYRDEHPYYVGKTGRLFSRLHDHANKSTDRYFNFWNYFSVFLVPEPRHIDAIEGILIASMATTANRSVPRIKKVKLPSEIGRILRGARQKKLFQWTD